MLVSNVQAKLSLDVSSGLPLSAQGIGAAELADMGWRAGGFQIAIQGLGGM